MYKDLVLAITSYKKAWALLNKHNMWSLVLLSGLFYTVLIGACLFGIFQLGNSIYVWAENLSWIKYCQAHFQFMNWILKILLAGVFLAGFFFSFSIYKYLLLTIASPLYAYISEKTENVLTGKEYNFSANQMIKDIIRGVRLSLRNLSRQLIISVLLFILAFVPIIGIFSTLLLILFDSYFYGFAMLDYNCERKKMNVKESIHFIKSRPGLALGNGLVFYGLFLIPVLGILIGAPLSVMAATISLHQEK
jgi:CysZ protein